MSKVDLKTKNIKKGIIFCDLEGVLTSEVSFWKLFNLELGVKEDLDHELYSRFIEGEFEYPDWINRLYLEWKNNFPKKLNRGFIESFCRSHVKINDGAKDFIKHCREQYLFIVVSGAPEEVLKIAQEELNFDQYYSMTKFYFDDNDFLLKAVGDEFGFEKDVIMSKITQDLGFDLSQTIAIGDSENDITMLNAAKRGILISEKNFTFYEYTSKIEPGVIIFERLDFKELEEKIDQFSVYNISVNEALLEKEKKEVESKKKKELFLWSRKHSNEEHVICSKILEDIKLDSDSMILDLGSGPGTILKKIANHFNLNNMQNLIAIDRNQEYRQDCLDNGLFFVGQDFKKDLVPGRFNLILQIFSIYSTFYLDDNGRNLSKKIFTHLKKEGKWIIILNKRTGVYEQFMEKFYYRVRKEGRQSIPAVPDWKNTLKDILSDLEVEVDTLHAAYEFSEDEIDKFAASILSLLPEEVKDYNDEFKDFFDSQLNLKKENGTYRFPMVLDYIIIEKRRPSGILWVVDGPNQHDLDYNAAMEYIEENIKTPDESLKKIAYFPDSYADPRNYFHQVLRRFREDWNFDIKTVRGKNKKSDCDVFLVLDLYDELNRQIRIGEPYGILILGTADIFGSYTIKVLKGNPSYEKLKIFLFISDILKYSRTRNEEIFNLNDDPRELELIPEDLREFFRSDKYIKSFSCNHEEDDDNELQGTIKIDQRCRNFLSGTRKYDISYAQEGKRKNYTISRFASFNEFDINEIFRLRDGAYKIKFRPLKENSKMVEVLDIEPILNEFF